jgi:hypothetical protein
MPRRQESNFQTNERLFRFHPPESSPAAGIWTVDVWRPQDTFGYTFWVDQTLYVQQYGIGLMKMVNDSLVVLQGGEQFANDRIHVMLPFPGKKGHYLVGTFSRGLFDWDGSIFRPWPSDADRLIADGTLYAGVGTPDSCFALGTMANGLVIIDRHGRLVQHFTQSSSFLSNTVSCLFLDQQRNLWVGMDGGVAVLEYDSPFSEYSIPEAPALPIFADIRASSILRPTMESIISMTAMVRLNWCPELSVSPIFLFSRDQQ